ncbi:hypothetical protein OS175_06485 [Marinicella sp. S1101]|uniref:hypothetical protein n=1 Tax=Marinicella marina TaxID=2996016 RepID=UPI002260B43F|nr:hypothetical protein [Marinicella marina]MCX7553520.1 hypothetical protein [Marinicella marina]MDJ1140144.1 hypothetical protein [Marinicella marina]
MKKKVITLLMLIIAFNTFAREFGLHFDDQGQIIKPDQEYLWRGLDDEKDGARNSAMKNFKLASEFGNYHAMSLVAYYYMQDKNYPLAHAWFKLIDFDKIPNRELLDNVVKNLQEIMSKDELSRAEALHNELIETYGSYPTLSRRMDWKKNLKFTGTNIKGYIPPFLRFQLNSGIQVTSNDLISQMDEFIFDYEFTVGTGRVTLDEIEVIEIEEQE